MAFLDHRLIRCASTLLGEHPIGPAGLGCHGNGVCRQGVVDTAFQGHHSKIGLRWGCVNRDRPRQWHLDQAGGFEAARAR